MKAVFSAHHEAHDPQFFLVRGKLAHSADRPERGRILLQATERAGLELLPAEEHGRAPLLAVHTLDYVRFLEEAHERWRLLEGTGPEVVANVHPVRRAATYPRSIIGRAGWHMADCACPWGPQSWPAARHSANAAVTAAELVAGGEREAYALCRPSGHHAYADMAGGFCYLNNTAVAAACLRRYVDRVAVLDIDVHHGNGTQGIFEDRADVLTVSIHADPNDYYPFFWGHAHERGTGSGEGFNVNLPLPVGAEDEAWLDALREAQQAIERFEPHILVLALGLDAHESDPLRGMRVSTRAFEQAAQMIATPDLPSAQDLPILIVQEGGYLSEQLGDNLYAFLTAFSASRSANRSTRL